MRLLRRYLLRQLLAPFVYGLGALTSMLLLNQIARRLGDLVGKGLEWGVIAEVLLLSLPFIIALTLPMAVLVAVLYAFSHLTADNEITAMRASGVSVAQILRPVFVAGAALTLVAFFFVDQVLPRTNARLRNLQLDIGRKKPTFTLREQAINPMQPSSYFLRAAQIEAATGRLREVTIYDLTPSAFRRVISADSGTMGFDAQQKDLRLVLYHGVVREYRPFEPAQVQLTTFDVNTVIVRDVENSLERGVTNLERGDREMTTCEMKDQVQLAYQAAREALQGQADLVRQDLRALLRLSEAEPPRPPSRKPFAPACGTWRETERFIERLLFPPPLEAQGVPASPPQEPVVPIQEPIPRIADSGGAPVARSQVALSPVNQITDLGDIYRNEVRKADSFAVEVHKKYAIGLACLNFVLIGLALALRFPRGGMGLVLGGSLAVFAVFYIGLTAGESLADRGYISAAVAMWTPNVMIAALGLWGLLKVNRESASSRGGDLADLLETVRGFVFRRRRAA